MTYEYLPYFQRLFRGRSDAFGTGKGQWVKRDLTVQDYLHHLNGEGPGLGVAPLLDDGTCWFAAIDLDEPDFAAAREMQDYIPGASWLERSRSGNAHVWVFFSDPIQAWLVRGILREAHLAADKKIVEVFPKQDKLKPGMLGNYINLPYFGVHPPTRPILDSSGSDMDVAVFLDAAQRSLNSPAKWQQRAAFLPNVVAPELRVRTSEPGEQPFLHVCAEHIIANCETNPITEGHRNAVTFALAKMLRNYAEFTYDEAWQVLCDVNQFTQPPLPNSELRRIFDNAEGFTSTDCDNPLVVPYTHPDCPIAHPRRH